MKGQNVEILAIATGMLAVGILSFILGINAGSGETRYQRRRATNAELNYQRLEAWITENFETEYHAWRLGHKQGYQQGVLDAPHLEDQDSE